MKDNNYLWVKITTNNSSEWKQKRMHTTESKTSAEQQSTEKSTVWAEGQTLGLEGVADWNSICSTSMLDNCDLAAPGHIFPVKFVNLTRHTLN